MKEVTHSSFFLTSLLVLQISVFVFIKSQPSIFIPDLISSHPLKDFAIILPLRDCLHQHSYYSTISYQNKHTKSQTNTPSPILLIPHISLLLYSISLFSFMGKLTLRVIYSHCLLTSSQYHLIEIEFFCLPLCWDYSQIHISSTGFF